MSNIPPHLRCPPAPEEVKPERSVTTECSLCGVILDKESFILPCAHLYCRPCLVKIAPAFFFPPSQVLESCSSKEKDNQKALQNTTKKRARDDDSSTFVSKKNTSPTKRQRISATMEVDTSGPFPTPGKIKTEERRHNECGVCQFPFSVVKTDENAPKDYSFSRCEISRRIAKTINTDRCRNAWILSNDRCQACPDKHLALYYCQQCTSYLCDRAVSAHLSLLDNQCHNIQLIPLHRSSLDYTLPLRDANQAFSTQGSDNDRIATQVELNQRREENVNKAKQVLDSLISQKNDTATALESVSSLCSAIQTSKKQQEDDINIPFDDFIKCLRAVEEEARSLRDARLKEIEDETSTAIEDLKDRARALEKHLAHISGAASVSEALIDRGISFQLFNHTPQLALQAQRLTEKTTEITAPKPALIPSEFISKPAPRFFDILIHTIASITNPQISGPHVAPYLTAGPHLSDLETSLSETTRRSSFNVLRKLKSTLSNLISFKN